MFDLLRLGNIGNYDQRAVAHYEEGGLVVDTCATTDGKRTYETAVAHPDYKGGYWVIVESYVTKEEAQKGHERWVEKMTKEPLPESLRDCQNAPISVLLAAVGGDEKLIFPRRIIGKKLREAIDVGEEEKNV